VSIQSFHPIFGENLSNNAHHLPFSLHTFRVLRASLLLSDVINLRLEPRASSAGTDPSLVHDVGRPGMVVYTRVYPGGVLGRVYTHHGIPRVY